MSNIRVLVIEDDDDVAKLLIEHLRERDDCYDCRHISFLDAENYIENFLPDVAILDLLSGGNQGEQEPVGRETYLNIWNKRFFPIVIHSAAPEAIEDIKHDHPFIEIVKKGAGSQKKVYDAIVLMKPQLESLREAENKIRLQFSLALRDVAPHAFHIFPREEQKNKRNDMIVRAGRRRLAALIDELAKSDDKILSWEQYIYPPLDKDLLLGDVLQRKDSPSDAPGSFAIVLTPSCDLVASRNRRPKVDHVLVAACCSIKDGIDKTSLKGIKVNKLKERLSKTILTSGNFEGILPFPSLQGKIPHMVADLKCLDLIPLKIIFDTFNRIASIDSPFRELVAWSYMQVACRPGLPDRDFPAWAEDIMATYK